MTVSEIPANMACHICGNSDLNVFLSLGATPLANAFLRPEQLGQTESRFPLDVCYCWGCGLVQLTVVVPGEVLFRDYPYQTGVSQTMIAHMAELASDAMGMEGRTRNDLIVDIGSNDGTLLASFKPYAVRVLGVEPASNIAALARQRGIPTLNAFFGKDVARQILSEHGPASVVLATNVLAHVTSLEEFVSGVAVLLSKSGSLVVEVPYLVDMIEGVEFDTIYHEHLRYYAVRPLVELFAHHGMVVADVKRVRIHGGSIRVVAKKLPATPSSGLAELLSLEARSRLNSLDTYLDFAVKARKVKSDLPAMLRDMKSHGKRVVGYGAPAKGNTLLNYCGIGTDLLDYLVDTTPSKQGRYSPGMHIPVIPENRFREEPPDYALMLAWNYEEEILRKEAAFLDSGGRFVIPIPAPRLVP